MYRYYCYHMCLSTGDVVKMLVLNGVNLWDLNGPSIYWGFNGYGDMSHNVSYFSIIIRKSIIINGICLILWMLYHEYYWHL